MNNEKPKLSLVTSGNRQEDELGNAVERILSESFDVERHIAAYEVDETASFFVILGHMSSIPAEIMDAVKERNAVLVIYYNAFQYPADADFHSFAGVRKTGVSEPESDTIRVFPHYLSRGLEEKEEVHGSRLIYDAYGELGNSDNIFVRTSGGAPLAFEKVYGKKGRVIGILFGQTKPPLTKVETRIFKNLKYLLHTGENIDKSFCSRLAQSIPFIKGELLEKHSLVGRWNTLATENGQEAIYTHSSVFLPLSPGHYYKKMAVWADGSTDKITKEKLFGSLLSVEIRAEDNCNMDCYYCYNRKSLDIHYKRTSLPEDVHIRLEHDLIAMRAKSDAFAVRYTGAGEPLCHKRTIPSIMAFEKAGIPTCLITNGTNMSPEQARELSTHATYIRFSVDAIRRETYTKIRRCSPAAFDTLIRNLKSMDQSAMLTGATFLVCKENFREIYSFCETMKALGVKVVWIRSTNDPDPFIREEMADIHEQIEHAQQLTDNRFFVFSEQFHIFRTASALHYRYGNIPCWSAYTKAFIQPNGDVVICLSHKEYVIGNIHRQSFSAIWGGERHIRFLRQTDFSRCSQCIESRYNCAINFMVNHYHDRLVLAKRTENFDKE
jgi:MoaA/NifB/PqqE/SkfB family radical SAM enzyme